MRYLCLVLVAACALTSKGKPRELRYFSPEPVHHGAPAAAEACHVELRIGRITASAHLRYRIVHRESPVELGMYETRRWTEAPDSYVRRSVERALFEARPIEQAVAHGAPTLDVEVLAFEEVVHGTQHAGRVELRYELHDDHGVIARGRVAAERAAGGPGIEQVVEAIGAAQDAATGELADRVVARVCQPA